MSNEITIVAPADELVRGQSVQVRITLRLDRPLKVRGIHARFQGAEETKANYTTTSTDGKGVTTTTTHTAVEQAPIVDQRFLLAGREPGSFFDNLRDATATMFGGGDHVVLQPGQYEYEVTVSVPADAPPTHVGKRSRVFYELTCFADVPLGRDLKSVQSFLVAPIRREFTPEPVRVRYPDDEGRGFWDKHFGPDVTIELALARDTFLPGESVDGIFQVETEQPVEVRAIHARLVGHESSQAHGHSDSHLHQGEPVVVARPVSIQGTYSERFSISAETVSDMPVTAKGQSFSIDWFVQIDLDVPRAKDPKIRAPVSLLPGA